LTKAKVGGFVLPFANPAATPHEARYLKGALADDQIIVAGVIDTLTNFIEHPRVVADRLETVAARDRRSEPTSRRHRLRLRHLGRHGPRRRVTSCGPSSRR